MSEMKLMTVEELYKICKSMIDEGKDDYKIYLATGGYYDDNATDYYNIDDDDMILTLCTPS